MITLLLDSSSTHLSVGIAKEKVVIATTHYFAWQSQSELFVPEIVALIEKNGLSFQQIDGIVVAIGPGSYTGVRIALTIAKTIGYILRIPVYKTSSLAILRIDGKPTICLINARSGRSYFGVYEGSHAIVGDKVLTNEEVHAFIKEHPGYAVSGQLDYLGLTGGSPDLFINMLMAAAPDNKIDNIHALKPVYLKENL